MFAWQMKCLHCTNLILALSLSLSLSPIFLLCKFLTWLFIGQLACVKVEGFRGMCLELDSKKTFDSNIKLWKLLILHGGHLNANLSLRLC
jgi:hypothetical protein